MKKSINVRAALGLALALTLGCTTPIDPPPTISSSSAEEIGGLPSSSSLPSGSVLCSLGEQCLYIPASDCFAIGGQEVKSCSPSAAPPTSSSSNAVNPLPSSSGGVSQQPVLSSSSSLSSGNVLCLFNGSCVSIDLGTCSAIGGQQVQICTAAISSSGALPSSNSTPLPSSNSAVPSSSSSSAAAIVIVPSSSSIALPSSSSVVVSGSSSSTRCTRNAQEEYFCQWTTGCWAIDPTYSEPAGQPCSGLVSNCRNFGDLYINSTVEGKDLSCNGTLLSTSGLHSSSSSSSAPSQSRYVTYEGYTYETVVIGTQTWFNRNLNYNASGSKCYGNNTDNCVKYGRLYNWVTAMNLPSDCNSSICASQISTKHRGICPSGWHIPSDADWKVLMKFVDPSCSDSFICGGAGTELKAISGWDPFNIIPSGRDNYGFSALPGGYGDSNGSFLNVGKFGYWWSSSEQKSTLNYAYYWSIRYDYEYASWDNYSKIRLFSVRCLMD